MCGIVAGVSVRNIVSVLVEGLRRLEYRGYDSCGVAVHQGSGLRRARSTARVAELAAKGQIISEEQLAGEMRERDLRDSTRADAPLSQAPDAVYFDSSGMSIEEVEEAMLKIVRARVTNGKEIV